MLTLDGNRRAKRAPTFFKAFERQNIQDQTTCKLYTDYNKSKSSQQT